MALDQQRLKARLRYDPETGRFTSIKLGRVVGWADRCGHLQIRVDGKRYSLHRLAWLYVYGSWPEGCIDHINCDPSDNRIKNLRIASRSTNAQNQRKPHAQNSTGFLGVCKDKNRYVAIIGLAGRTIWIGSFDSPQRAHEAYVEAKRRLHPGCTL